MHLSKYADHTHCENLNCVGGLEIGQAGYLLNHARTCTKAKQVVEYLGAGHEILALISCA